MTISDSNGPTSARPSSANRSDVTRDGGGSARYQAIDSGGSGGSGSDPYNGSSAGGEARPCALIVWWEEWHTMEDERTCPECAPLHKQWYEQGKGPAPPLHDHCRCWRELVWWDCYQSDGTWESGGRAQ